VLDACFIKNRVLNLSYSKTVQCKKGDSMHIIFTDHTSQYVKVYELWHLKWVAQHMNRWSYIYSVIL